MKIRQVSFNALLIHGLCLMLVAVTGGKAHVVEKPNVIWITAEDMGPNMGSYGDQNAATPNLDQLASEGVRYSKAFSVAGVCAPSRSSLISGLYASSLGAQHMRCLANFPADLKTLPEILRINGYYTTNRAKQDYNFKISQDAWDDSGREAHWRNRPAGKPFFSVFNLMVTHESRLRFEEAKFRNLTRNVTPEQRHDPADMIMPAWLPDDPAVRREWARYNDMISEADHEVADLLAQLKEEGIAEDTIVFFFGDHGAGVPRAKQFNFEAGLHVPLLVYVPEKWRERYGITPGTIDDSLVSLVDLPPTVLSILDIPVPETMQGRAFMGRGKGAQRDYIYSIRDRMDERVDMSRTVRDERYKYHRNYMPHLPHYPWLDYMDLLETSKVFRDMAKRDTLSTGLEFFMADRKPLEELYDLAVDPDELNNIAADPEYAAVLTRLRTAHFSWVKRTRDTGFIPEQMLREITGESEYGYAQSDDYQLERCIDTVRLVEKGVAAVPELVLALEDAYPPIRFWAATGLATLGAEARAAVPALRKALGDEYEEVAIASAEALGYMGNVNDGLPLLERCLASSKPIVRLASANVVDRLGEAARPILPAIRHAAAIDEGPVSGANPYLMVQWVLAHALRQMHVSDAVTATAADAVGVARPIPPALVEVGVGRIEITPPMPVRLHGFPRGERAESVSTIAQPIFAKAMAFGRGPDAVLLLTADLLGISDELADQLMVRLQADTDFKIRENLAFTATHTHSAPAISSVAPYVFRKQPTMGQEEEISRYEAWLVEQLAAVAKQALDSRRPAQVAYGVGSADFGMNRRLIENGEWTGFGDNPTAAIDHDLPVMTVREPDGQLRAIWFSYACHGVCWQKPSVHGDWMGVAQQILERDHAGAIALVSVGCGGDVNPLDRYFRGQDPVTPGLAAAAAVEKALEGVMLPLPASPRSAMVRFELPLAEPPGLLYWEGEDDWFSQTQAEKLRRGQPLDRTLSYVAQSWSFGRDLSVLFLAGEVFSGYSVRLKHELDGSRLWVNAYANTSPAYIPTKQALREGGYEIDTSRLSYGLPARLAPEAEDILMDRVKALVPEAFHPGAMVSDSKSSPED